MAKENDATRFKGFANANAIDLARFEASEIKRVLKTLEDLEVDIVGVLQRESPSIAKQKRIREIQTAVGDAINETYGTIALANKKTLGDLSKISHDSTVAVLNKSVGATVVNPVLTENQLSKLANSDVIFGRTGSAGTAKVGQWWAAQRDDMKEKFARQLRLGYALGEDVDQIARRVRGSTELRFKDGITAISKRNAETLAITSIQNISNEARIATFAQNADVVKGIQWLATLDDKTCPICRALDGLQWELNANGSIGAPVGHSRIFPGGVAHYRCRCTQTSVTRSWDELAGRTKGTKTPPANPTVVDLEDDPKPSPAGKKKTAPENLLPFPPKIPRKTKPGESPFDPVPLPAKPNPQRIAPGEGEKTGGLTSGEFEKRVRRQMAKDGVDPAKIDKAVVNARASMDGQAADTEDFDSWLRKQGTSRRKKILGPTRMELFDRGVITTRDMTDQSNRPLTIVELQKKVSLGLFIAAETEGIRQSFKALDPDEVRRYTKPDAAAEVEKAAAARIEEVLTNPAGSELLASEIQRVLNSPGASSLSPAEVHARAVARVEAIEFATRKANVLRRARGRIIRGDKPTPSQARVIQALSPAERKNFEDWLK